MSFTNIIKLGEQDFVELVSDLKETADEIKVYFEIPEVDKRDINLNITDNSVEIKVEKKEEMGEFKWITPEKEIDLMSRKPYSGFYRYRTLPCKILVDGVIASYKNNILEIVMPKAEKKKLRKVEVR